jgi:hypothetical protein
MTTREKLYGYIDAMPEHSLVLIEPLLAHFAGEVDRLVIGDLIFETDLTEEEEAVIEAGRKEREEHPENFTSWDEIREEYLREKGD